MLGKDVLKTVMKARGYTRAFLAQKLGYATHSGISERLRGKEDVRVDTLVKMLNAMDCELVVRSKLRDRTEWVIDGSVVSDVADAED